MPTYEYECPKCGHAFEKFQSISDPPVKTCPKCRGRKVKRLPGTGAGILFRGSGFHQTDYRSDSYHKQAKKETEAPGAEGKTDGKEKKDRKEKTDGKSKSESAPEKK
jgi:putative FmdB family regulatory protein